MTAAAARIVAASADADAAQSSYVRSAPQRAHDRSLQMYLLTEELARDRIAQRRREAEAHRLVRTAVLARRAKRSTAKAVLRARVVALATR
jgi:hypothetical protein